MASVTVPLDQAMESKLVELARRTGRSPSDLAAQALESFVEVQAWQMAEIEAAVAEADRGAFASDDEVADAKRRWTL